MALPKVAVKRLSLSWNGKDYYRTIGAKGGSKSGTGGFAWMKANGQLEKLSASGRLGGSLSRRGKAKNKLSPADRKLIRNRHLAKHAELYRLSDEQVSKLSRRFK